MLLLWAILGFLALFCEARVLQGSLKLIAPVPPPSWATLCLTWPFSFIIQLCFESRRRKANASTFHKGSSFILTFAYLFCVHMHTHRFACNIHMTVMRRSDNNLQMFVLLFHSVNPGVLETLAQVCWQSLFRTEPPYQPQESLSACSQLFSTLFSSESLVQFLTRASFQPFSQNVTPGPT